MNYKPTFFILFILFFLQNKALLQVRKVIDRSLVIQKEIPIPELKCVQGKKLIESFLLRNDGIVEVNTNLSARIIKVSYIKTLTSVEEILVAISNTGYQADTALPNLDAKKLLPICCLDTFTENTVKTYYDMEREKFRKAKKRYREKKKFICCRSCDIIVQYRNLVK